MRAGPIACVFLMLPGIAPADSVPPHLAGMAATLYGATSGLFEEADPDTTQGWASLRARDTMQEAGVHRWRAAPPPGWQGQVALMELLSLDVQSDGDTQAALDFLSDARERGVEAATRAFMAAREAALPADEGERGALFARIEEALASGYGDLERSYVFAPTEGPDLTLDWAPEQGRFSMVVTEEGSPFDAAFSSTLSADLTPTIAPDGTLNFALEPSVDPLVSYDAAELEAMRGNIYGEWVDQDGVTWVILPTGGEAVSEEPREGSGTNRQASALARLNAARAELDALRGSKVYVWTNPETGERQEQDRFRRLKDPWDYQGEGTSGSGTEEQIAALEQEILELAGTLEAAPETEGPPPLPEVTDDGSVRALFVSYERDDGSVAVMDEAVLAGGTIRGNRVLTDPRDIRDLPETVINQLVSSWSPPEWIEFDVSQGAGGQVQIAGPVWRLHVTYSGMSYSVESIHTPYPTPHTLSRDGRRKAP